MKGTYNKEEIWRKMKMNNEVLEKMLQFLNQLRCEEQDRKSSVQIPGLKEKEKETEMLLDECGKSIECLSLTDKQKIKMWIEKKEEFCYMQEQKAYCQGYVDCILILSGLGLLQPELSYNSFMDILNN